MIKNLEGLRGIAAVIVVIFHFKVGSHLNNSFTDNGYWMVDFFFVLSGFVIFLSYNDRLDNFLALVQFSKRRFLRLYPLHLVMLVVFLVFEIAKYVAEMSFDLKSSNPPFSENNWVSFAANFFLIQNWVLDRLTYNYPSWSISAEFFTYLIFAATFVIVKSSKVFIPLIFFYIIWSAFTLIGGDSATSLLGNGPTRCIFGFFIGVFIFLFHDATINLKLDNSIFAGILICLAVFLISRNDVLPYKEVVLPLIFGLTIFTIVKTSDRALLSRVLSLPCFIRLGTISYGIYMTHAAVLWVTTQILRVVFEVSSKQGTDGGVFLDITSVWLSDLLMLTVLLITLFVAHLSYYWIEMPFSKPPR